VYTDLNLRPPGRPDALPGGELLHGRAGLINSGGASSGESDLAEAVRTAVINKRAGGMGLNLRPQGLSAADEGGRWHPERDSGCVPVEAGDRRLNHLSQSNFRDGVCRLRHTPLRFMLRRDHPALPIRVPPAAPDRNPGGGRRHKLLLKCCRRPILEETVCAARRIGRWLPANGPARAIDGIMEVEKKIIRLAEERNIHGLRFEWNDDLDFGHLLDRCR